MISKLFLYVKKTARDFFSLTKLKTRFYPGEDRCKIHQFLKDQGGLKGAKFLWTSTSEVIPWKGCAACPQCHTTAEASGSRPTVLARLPLPECTRMESSVTSLGKRLRASLILRQARQRTTTIARLRVPVGALEQALSKE